MGANWAAGILRRESLVSDVSSPSDRLLIVTAGAVTRTVYFPDSSDYIVDQSVVQKGISAGAEIIVVEQWAMSTAAGAAYAEENGAEVMKVGVFLARAKNRNL